MQSVRKSAVVTGVHITISTSGWAKPTSRTMFHYFRSGTSLCGRYLDGEFSKVVYTGPEKRCKACFGRRFRELDNVVGEIKNDGDSTETSI